MKAIRQPNVGTFCAPLGTEPAGPDAECLNATDCQAGFHCAVIGGVNKCRPYCHDATPSELPCVGQGQTCNPISGVSSTSEARTACTLSFASLETARTVLVTLDRLAAVVVTASPRTT